MRFLRTLVAVLAVAWGFPAMAQRAPLVVTANPLLSDLVRSLAGDAVTTHCLLPAGVRYQDYEPTSEDAKVLADAALLVVNGLELEPSLEPLSFEAGFSGEVILAGEGFSLLNTEGELQDPVTGPGTDQGLPDPYAWHDPRNVRTYVQTIALALSDLLPTRAAEIDAQLRVYLQQLDAAHAYAEEQFAPLSGNRRHLATSLDFLGYLAHAYQFTLVPIPGPGAGLQPSSPAAQMLADGYRQLGYPAVFVPADAGSRTLRFIASESDVTIVASLSEGPGTGESYLQTFRTNVDAIAKALRIPDVSALPQPEPLNPIMHELPASALPPERE